MSPTPPAVARAQQRRSGRAQEGTVLSWTVVRHPPAGFPQGARRIGLIALDDGTHVLGQLTDEAAIGQRVRPDMRLQRVNPQGLRIYDIAYVPAPAVDVSKQAPAFGGYILALYGPSGVGKSTVSRMIAHVLAEVLEPVPILTTRSVKAGDDGEYEHASVPEFLELRRKGLLSSSTKIPSLSEERWYGYRDADIRAIWERGKIPVVITEAGLLQGLAKHYGRRSILSCGLLPPGKSKRAMLSHLLHRLRARGRDTEEHIHDRLKNAQEDLHFFEKCRDMFDHVVVNEQLDHAVETLKQAVLAHRRS